jgi:hypothetical protein
VKCLCDAVHNALSPVTDPSSNPNSLFFRYFSLFLFLDFTGEVSAIACCIIASIERRLLWLLGTDEKEKEEDGIEGGG